MPPVFPGLLLATATMLYVVTASEITTSIESVPGVKAPVQVRVSVSAVVPASR